VAPLRSAQASNFDYRVSPDGKQALISVNRATKATRTTEYYSVDLANASAPLQLLSTLPYSAEMRAATWGQGGSIYALITDGCCIKRLDVTKGKESKQIALTNTTTWVTTPDLKRLYSAAVLGGEMTLVASDLETGESIATIGTQINRLAMDRQPELDISRDGTRLITAFGQLVTLWDARALNQVMVLVQDKAVARVPTRGGSVGFDNTGQYVIKYTGYAEVNLPHSVTWWDAATGKQIAQVYYSPKATGFRGGAAITVSPRGDTLAILDRIVEVVAIYDAQTGKLIYTDPPPASGKSASSPASSPPQAITYDPSGSMIVLAKKDGALSVRDARTGTELRQLTFAPQGYFRRVDFTGDGTVLVADSGQEAFVVP
jgi:WD40 repeat protein